MASERSSKVQQMLDADTKIMVLAGSHAQFDGFLKEQMLHMRQATYIKDAADLMGHRPGKSEVILYGTPEYRNDFGYIARVISDCGFHPISI